MLVGDMHRNDSVIRQVAQVGFERLSGQEVDLGVKSLRAFILGTEATFVGEGADLVIEKVPDRLTGTRLRDGKIAEQTGLNVVAIQHADGTVESAAAETLLGPGDEIVMLCTHAQRQDFRAAFE